MVQIMDCRQFVNGNESTFNKIEDPEDVLALLVKLQKRLRCSPLCVRISDLRR